MKRHPLIAKPIDTISIVDWKSARRRVEEAKRMLTAALASIAAGNPVNTLQALDLAREDLTKAVKALATLTPRRN